VGVGSNPPPQYLEELLLNVGEKELYSDKTWLVLGHYKKNMFGDYISQVDSADFFLSPRGKTDPKAELESTLAAFFSSRPLEPVKLSAQCRFIARFHWLNQQLKFDTNKLKFEQCKDFDIFMKFVEPEKIAVIFPTTHPNSPSSMFGHTLLRLDKKNQTAETRMLNYSINYAAQVDLSVGALSYSMRGLSGGFPGKYSVVPYYTKLREYAQMENRDVWEYTLNIPKDKIDFILKHVYELAPSYFDYYFFSENCSYHLLSLLDLAYPDDQFTKEFTGWTIPIDTIRYLSSRGFISDVSYHPSHARIIKARQATMVASDVSLAFNAFELGLENIKDEMAALDPSRKVLVLDLLNDLYRYDKLKNSEHSATKLNKKERTALLARSKIKQASEKIEVIAPSIRPDEGHSSARVGVGAVRNLGANAVSLSWRPAYHDLLDPSAGFVSNSSLGFMNVIANYDVEKGSLKIDELTVLDIFSLEPKSSFFKSVSWKMKIGWEDSPSPQRNDITFIDGGVGIGYSLLGSHDHMLYGFADVLTEYSTKGDEMNLSSGASVGLIAEPIHRWRVNIFIRYSDAVIGLASERYSINVQQSIALANNLSVRAELGKMSENNVDWHEGKATLFYYY
ncbi:MAG: DUF4105 domain-containing protein, partial [Gammaproteobacteria bacterium]|nr:DUF4105 domain-containing protein [Gammaproteobacteria bacterium]